ncbi:MAG: hypothetical protein ACYCVY_02010 [Acidiferrobacteraceae bacterium]
MPRPPDIPSCEPSTETARRKSSTPPGEGERRAHRGYGRQYQSAAAAIYAALERGDLAWVGLVADRAAGIADDLVLGLSGRVIGYQLKTSQYSEQFRLSPLLVGKNGLLRPLADAWQRLKSTNPNEKIEIHLVTNDFPSTNDNLDGAGHSTAFLAEFERSPDLALAEWRATKWRSFIRVALSASQGPIHSRRADNFFRTPKFSHSLADNEPLTRVWCV